MLDGVSSWTGGQISGSGLTVVVGTLTVSSEGSGALIRTISNQGRLIWNQPSLALAENSGIINHPNGTLEIQRKPANQRRVPAQCGHVAEERRAWFALADRHELRELGPRPAAAGPDQRCDRLRRRGPAWRIARARPAARIRPAGRHSVRRVPVERSKRHIPGRLWRAQVLRRGPQLRRIDGHRAPKSGGPAGAHRFLRRRTGGDVHPELRTARRRRSRSTALPIHRPELSSTAISTGRLLPGLDRRRRPAAASTTWWGSLGSRSISPRRSHAWGLLATSTVPTSFILRAYDADLNEIGLATSTMPAILRAQCSWARSLRQHPPHRGDRAVTTTGSSPSSTTSATRTRPTSARLPTPGRIRLPMSAAS